jgi:hypothetical protein
MILKSVWFTVCTIVVLAYAIFVLRALPDALSSGNPIQIGITVLGSVVLLSACYATGKEALGRGM